MRPLTSERESRIQLAVRVGLVLLWVLLFVGIGLAVENVPADPDPRLAPACAEAPAGCTCA